MWYDLAMDAVSSHQGEIIDSMLAEISRAVDVVLNGASPNSVEQPTTEDSAVLGRLAVALPTVEFAKPVAPMTHPAVDRWLIRAVPNRGLGSADDVATFARCAPLLHWNTAYADLRPSPEIERFWENYSYAVLVSPDGGIWPPAPCRSDGLALFLVVQGADVVYGSHHHPATEIYGVVAGTARWLRGNDGYRSRGPGDVFVHHSNMVHATTTGAAATISWAAWLGDLCTKPSMT